MIEEENNNYPGHIADVLEDLEQAKTKVKYGFMTLLQHGECNTYSSGALGEGYPFDYDLYAKESMEPQIQALYQIYENLKKAIETIKSGFIETVMQEVPLFWNGYCPESYARGKIVRMKLNKDDFYESEETGLQIAVLKGVQAIIMRFRGKGNFRTNASYADEIENGEYLSPQTSDKPPFNNGEIFENSLAIVEFINKI